MHKILFAWLLAAGASAQWRDHEVRQLNGQAPLLRFRAQAQDLGEAWGRSLQWPYVIHMPEKDELLMLVLSERPTRALLSLHWRGHMPNCHLDGVHDLHKVVVKVRHDCGVKP